MKHTLIDLITQQLGSKGNEFLVVVFNEGFIVMVPFGIHGRMNLITNYAG